MSLHSRRPAGPTGRCRRAGPWPVFHQLAFLAGTSICEMEKRASSSAIARGAEGMSGTSMSSTLLGRWVKTMTATAPKRRTSAPAAIELRPATTLTAARTPPRAATVTPQRAWSQKERKASSVRPPPKESTAKSAERRSTCGRSRRRSRRRSKREGEREVEADHEVGSTAAAGAPPARSPAAAPRRHHKVAPAPRRPCRRPRRLRRRGLALLGLRWPRPRARAWRTA